jgi:hypothetical protein
MNKNTISKFTQFCDLDLVDDAGGKILLLTLQNL